VLKLSPPREKIFPRDDLAKQHNIMNALHARGLPTPRSLWLELDPEPLGGPFLIMEKMDGVVIGDRPPGVHGTGLLFDASEAERARYWASCIEFLARLHAVDASHADFAFLGTPRDARDTLLQKLDGLEALLRWAEQVLPRIDDLHHGLQWLREHCPTPSHYSVCWDDAKIGNILFKDGRLAAALDWEGADLGPGELDLAYWVFVDEASFTTNKLPRLAGLPDMAGTIALYEKFSGHPVEDFDYYLTFASCKLAIYLALAARLDKLTGAFGGRHNAADNAIINRMRARLGSL
jgi:aminoglycoside phosphotransferase (APT) family kinase protein